MPRILLFASLLACLAAPAFAAKPEIVSVERIWNEGPHNAFTDLIRFQDKWFCTFRESTAHVGGDGGVRVLVSDDGDTWRSAALIQEKGVDLRDPKLSITPDGRLMIVAGGSIYNGTTTLQGRQPRVVFSDDGLKWGEPIKTLGEGDWLWRVTWHKGKAYGVAYNALRPAGKDWTIRLVASDNGIDYETITYLEVSGRANETTLRFAENDELIALVRREEGSRMGWIGVSKPPYTKWTWSETKHRLGGPNFIQTKDGNLWATSRLYYGSIADPSQPNRRTILARMTRDSLDPLLEFPSGGDTSYAGMVEHDGLLWLSYYSSHEGKSSIYIAKVKLP